MGRSRTVRAFPVSYSTPVSSGGYNFPRGAHNQILKDITAAIQFLQQNGASNFITSAMNNGSSYPYNLGAVVMYNAGRRPPVVDINRE